jgi:hypothetical protein
MKSPFQSPLTVTVLPAVVLLTAVGCSSLFDSGKTVCRQEEAVSAHIAVVSVAPWETYRDLVQATFKLSPDDALAQVMPNTMALEQKIINAFGLTAKAALPGTTMSGTKTFQSEAGKAPTTSETQTETTTSGQTSNLTFSASPAGSRTASGLPPSTSVLGTGIGVDPMLR